MQAVTNKKKFYQQTWFVIIALLVFAPVGLCLAWTNKSWSSGAKMLATIIAVPIFLYALITGGNQQEQSTTSTSSSSQAKEAAPKPEAKKPIISVSDAKTVDGIFTLDRQQAKSSFAVTTGDAQDKTNTSLTINGVAVKPSVAGPNYFSYSTTLKPGDNKFAIVATNAAGKDEKELIVKYTPPTPVDDTLFEAEITCQQYAEKELLVKDINIHYDQSSIKKKQADGTIIIKVNIADSQGWLHPEKPLGIMECTTDATGMKVNKFINY